MKLAAKGESAEADWGVVVGQPSEHFGYAALPAHRSRRPTWVGQKSASRIRQRVTDPGHQLLPRLSLGARITCVVEPADQAVPDATADPGFLDHQIFLMATVNPDYSSRVCQARASQRCVSASGLRCSGHAVNNRKTSLRAPTQRGSRLLDAPYLSVNNPDQRFRTTSRTSCITGKSGRSLPQNE